MASKAIEHLERGVKFTTAAKKLAKIRGDYGREGGWIYNRFDKPVAHGWRAYGDRLVAAGLLHHDGNGKWYVFALGLTAAETARAEELYG